MSAPKDLKLLRSIKTGKGLIKLIKNLKTHHKASKIKAKRSALLGVWAKTKVMNDPVLGLEIANSFVQYEIGVRKRRNARHIAKQSPNQL